MNFFKAVNLETKCLKFLDDEKFWSTEWDLNP
jgi:hypothetical protein